MPLFNWQTLRELEKHTEAAIAAGFRICSGKITFSGQTVAGSMMLVSGRYFQVMAVQPSAGPPELRQRRRTGPPATRSQWWTISIIGRRVGRPNELNRTVKGQWPPFTVAGFVRAASPAARRQAGRLLSYLIARLRPGMTRDA